ncbi:MAG: uridine kinase [Planctomycetes bacterium]|nr:uridine kinase [Planctomycetota bacterium]
MPDLAEAVERIVTARTAAPGDRAVLVAVSGVDACGKGFVTDRLVDRLAALGLKAAPIHADGWLHLPQRRFSRIDPARHFYHHAFRFAEMFSQLVTPLCARRSIDLEADYTEETATSYRRHRYTYHDVDVVLLEAIFLFKREWTSRYDVALWVDCTFETALERALARGQEGLDAQATVRAYETIYFPAQRIHRLEDQPLRTAHGIISNDPRLTPLRP